MMKFTFLLLTLLSLNFAVQAREDFTYNPEDTSIVPPKEEDKVIEEIIQSKAAPKKEKVQYFQQVTKYGFKNLFNNLSYNPSMPYRSQVNPYAENYMQDYLASHGSTLLKMKTWAPTYFNLIDNIFSQYGLPKELKYLAVIESHLSASATSWVGARGPWQFMPYTAREYGLHVSGYLDERTDYYKSTHAAAKYLLRLYKDLKDWLLVIAAYNGGRGRVYSAIRKSGSRDFWALQYNLPTESRNHVKKFIATHYIMEGNGGPDAGIQSAYNYSGLTPATAKTFTAPKDVAGTEVLPISGKYNASIIAKNLQIDIAEFNKINPGFDMTMSSGDSFDLRLPAEKMDLFVANKYAILNECVEALLNNVNTETKTVYSKAKQGNLQKRRKS
jgi:membrane-bound lytic murein transglycosylase D